MHLHALGQVLVDVSDDAQLARLLKVTRRLLTHCLKRTALAEDEGEGFGVRVRCCGRWHSCAQLCTALSCRPG